MSAAKRQELEAALERLRPILQNSKEAFEDPNLWEPSSVRGYRLEGLALGCMVGLEVIHQALGAKP